MSQRIPKRCKVCRRNGKNCWFLYNFQIQYWQRLRITNPDETIEGLLVSLLHAALDPQAGGVCVETYWRRELGFNSLVKVGRNMKFIEGEEVIAEDQSVVRFTG